MGAPWYVTSKTLCNDLDILLFTMKDKIITSNNFSAKFIQLSHK